MKRRKTDKKKTSSRYWRDKADKVWRKIIIGRASGCAVCGRNGKLDTHHLIGRGAVFYRHELSNGIALCSQCHLHNTKLSAHLAPWAFEEWIKENRPEQWRWWEKNRHNIVTGRRINYKAKYEELAEIAENEGANL